MPQPTKSDVHVNAPLTNVSVAFFQDQSKYVATKIFPMVPVQKQSDVYFIYPRDKWFTDEMQKRAPGTESAGSGYDVSTDSYSADVWALHKDVDDQLRANADDPVDPDREATEWLTQKQLIRMEKEWVTNFFAASTWTGSTTGADIVAATKWDAAAGDPLGDVEDQMNAAEEKTGFMPNKMVVTPAVHKAIRNNADVIDRIKHTQQGIVTEQLLASMFGLDEYLVLRATHNTAKENATRVMAYIGGAGEGAALYYVPDNPGLYTPAAGYTFGWTGLLGSGATASRISNFRMEHLKSDRVEIEAAFAEKLVASDLGVFFSDVLT